MGQGELCCPMDILLMDPLRNLGSTKKFIHFDIFC